MLCTYFVCILMLFLFLVHGYSATGFAIHKRFYIGQQFLGNLQVAFGAYPGGSAALYYYPGIGIAGGIELMSNFVQQNTGLQLAGLAKKNLPCRFL